MCAPWLCLISLLAWALNRQSGGSVEQTGFGHLVSWAIIESSSIFTLRFSRFVMSKLCQSSVRNYLGGQSKSSVEAIYLLYLNNTKSSFIRFLLQTFIFDLGRQICYGRSLSAIR